LKPSMLDHSILALGVLIIVLASLTGAAVSAEFDELCGVIGTGKVTAELLDKANLDASRAITMGDIRHLENFYFKGIELAYASESRTTAVYEEDQAPASIAGVSGSYSMFHRLQLETGSFITPGNKKEMVAVVDEGLALELFNNTNVVGMYIQLYGRGFKIIGVVSGDNGTVYVPVEHMLKLDTDSRITSLEIRAEDMGTIGANINNMKEGLASIGKNAADYRILDYNLEKKLMEEKAQLASFLAGIGIIIMLLCLIRRKLMEIYTTWRIAYQKYYFRDVLRRKGAKLGLLLAEMAILLALAVFTWNAVKVDIYIPADYIPDELIDMEFYSDLIKSLLQENIHGIGHTPSLPEMKNDVLRTIQDWNLIVSISAGYPIYLLGLRLLEKRQESRMKHMVLSSVFIGISVAAGLLLLKLTGLPVRTDTQAFLVVAAFILLSSSGLGQSVLENVQEFDHNKRSDIQ